MFTPRQAAMALSLGVIANFVRAFSQLLALPIIARLIGPDSMALFILANPLLNFFVLLADGGMSQALAKEKYVSKETLSSAFWGIMLLSGCMAIFFDIIGIIASYLTGHIELRNVVFALSASIILIGLAVIPNALALQKANLSAVPTADIISQIIATGVAISMAYAEFGVWSLISQVLVLFFFRTLILNFWFPYIPCMSFRFESIKVYYATSFVILMSRIVDLLGRSLENFSISFLFGAYNLGIFGFSNQMGRFFTDSIGNTVWSSIYISSVSSSYRKGMNFYWRSSRLMLTIVLPAAIGASIILSKYIDYLLGTKWEPALLPLVTVLVTYPFCSLANLGGAVALARDNGTMFLYFLSLVSIARISSIYISHTFGINYVFVSLAIVNMGSFLLSDYFLLRNLGIRRWSGFLNVRFIVLSALLAFVSVIILPNYLFGMSNEFAIVRSILFFILYLIALYCFDRKTCTEDFLTILKSVR